MQTLFQVLQVLYRENWIKFFKGAGEEDKLSWLLYMRARFEAQMNDPENSINDLESAVALDLPLKKWVTENDFKMTLKY